MNTHAQMHMHTHTCTVLTHAHTHVHMHKAHIHTCTHTHNAHTCGTPSFPLPRWPPFHDLPNAVLFPGLCVSVIVRRWSGPARGFPARRWPPRLGPRRRLEAWAGGGGGHPRMRTAGGPLTFSCRTTNSTSSPGLTATASPRMLTCRPRGGIRGHCSWAGLCRRSTPPSHTLDATFRYLRPGSGWGGRACHRGAARGSRPPCSSSVVLRLHLMAISTPF